VYIHVTPSELYKGHKHIYIQFKSDKELLNGLSTQVKQYAPGTSLGTSLDRALGGLLRTGGNFPQVEQVLSERAANHSHIIQVH
jgi:hypothetical protein